MGGFKVAFLNNIMYPLPIINVLKLTVFNLKSLDLIGNKDV